MITNRTAEDVSNAIMLRDTKVKNFESLSTSEIEILERGTITISTINRIEAKQAELKSMLNEIGYYNTPIETKTDWSENDIFSILDFERIVQNLNVLRDAFFVYSGTPPTPLPRYYYENLNDIEKILVDIEDMIDDLESFYGECGTFRCGE